MIKDVLISELKKRFPTKSFKEGLSPSPIVVFPATHSEIGDVIICEEGEELVVAIGKITHGHFYCYDKSLSANQRNDEVVRRVVDYLDDLFSDKVLFWASESGAGGSTFIKGPTDLKRVSEWKGMKELIESGVIKDDGRYFLWSGPVDIDEGIT